MQFKQADIIVAGAGLAGLTATLALLRNGISVINIAPAPAKRDQRTTALWSNSVEFLNSLGVEQALLDHGSPLRTIRMIDATNRLIRSPQIEFHSSEIGLEFFGYNIDNYDLSDSLRKIIASIDPDALIEASVSDMKSDGSNANLALSTGDHVAANLVIGADGRNSAIRKASGISVRNWSYPQTAIVLNFKHSLPHDDVSTEFHTVTGPFTTVPLGPETSSLVWVETPEVAASIRNLDRDELEVRIEQRMHSMLGKITIISDIQSFPLSGMIANSFGSDRAVLVGEAAHIFPPIGAQGFNLGIRDIQAITKLLAAKRSMDTIASEYNRMRRTDVETRTASVDLMNRTLLSNFLPVQALRGAGMAALASIGPLRRLAMREGVAPGQSFRMFSNSIADRLPRRQFGAR